MWHVPRGSYSGLDFPAHLISSHLTSTIEHQRLHNRHTAMSSGSDLSPHDCHQASSTLERRRMGTVHSALVLFTVSASCIILL